MKNAKPIITVILRFRDLVTPQGGSIASHQQIVDQHGYVWWGWWKRQTEAYPGNLFSELHQRLVGGENPITAFVFDSGSESLYRTQLQKLAVAPPGGTIATPNARKSPAYYQQGAYPAWFQFLSFQKCSFTDIVISHHSFPTNSEMGQSADCIGSRIVDPKSLRLMDVTLYVVNLDVESLKSEK